MKNFQNTLRRAIICHGAQWLKLLNGKPKVTSERNAYGCLLDNGLVPPTGRGQNPATGLAKLDWLKPSYLVNVLRIGEGQLERNQEQKRLSAYAVMNGTELWLLWELSQHFLILLYVPYFTFNYVLILSFFQYYIYCFLRSIFCNDLTFHQSLE